MTKNPYEILGVPYNATAKEIKAAYYSLAKIFHPDKVEGDEEAKAAAARNFAEISNAYEILTNPHATEYPSSSQEYESSSSEGHMEPMRGAFSDFSSPFFPQPQSPFAPFFFGGQRAGSAFFGDERPFLNPFFQFTDPFVLFEQTFGRHAFDMDPTEHVMSAFQASNIPSSNVGGGFSMAFSSSSTQSVSDAVTGGYKTITKTTQMINGKKTTRTETTLVYPDGHRETTVEVQEGEGLPRLTQGTSNRREALPPHDYQHGRRSAPASAHSKRTYSDTSSARGPVSCNRNDTRAREQQNEMQPPTWGDRLHKVGRCLRSCLPFLS